MSMLLAREKIFIKQLLYTSYTSRERLKYKENKEVPVFGDLMVQLESQTNVYFSKQDTVSPRYSRRPKMNVIHLLECPFSYNLGVVSGVELNNLTDKQLNIYLSQNVKVSFMKNKIRHFLKQNTRPQRKMQAVN